jgi:cytochrome P450 family 135
MTISAALPPGPSAPAAAQLIGWTLRPGPWLERCWRRYGDAFTVRRPGAPPLVFLVDPDDVKRVFTGDPEVMRVGPTRVGIQPMFGDRSVLLLDAPEHLRERRLLLPPFHGERMTRYGELMAEVAEREVASWAPGRPFALQDRLQEITLEIILRAVFGMDADERLDAMRTAISRLLEATASPATYLLVAVPKLRRGPAEWVFQRVLRAADDLIHEQISRRRADPRIAERDDVLSLLIQARDEDGRPLSDAQLRDELVTLLLAGHETTATALAWTLELLWRHPAQLGAVASACRAGEAGEPLVEAALKEALRLRPPIGFVERRVAEPFAVAGRVVPAGTELAPCIYLVHRRPDLYPEPRAFRPERFLERGGARETYTWLPFGGGVRRCLGASFAMFEMKVVLGTILRSVEIERAGAPAGTRRRSIVLAPEGGARAVVRARLGAAA